MGGWRRSGANQKGRNAKKRRTRWRVRVATPTAFIAVLVLLGVAIRPIATAASGSDSRPTAARTTATAARSRASHRHANVALCSRVLRDRANVRAETAIQKHCQHLLIHTAARAHHRARHQATRSASPPPTASGRKSSSHATLAEVARAHSAPAHASCPHTATTSGCVSRAVADILPALVPAGTAQIKGTVTDAVTTKPIAGIEVCAASEAAFECALTGAAGEYDITGLVAGSYTVSFAVPFESGLNYLPQFYDGKSSFAEATHVAVTTGATVSGIDAAMHAGGQISGTVTDAKTKAGITGIQVCATSTGEEEFVQNCVRTGAGGEYVVPSLSTAQYVVDFATPNESNLNYLEQFYNDKGTREEANHVAVTAGSITPNINAALAEGGKISGKVTDANTHAPLEKIFACATTISGEFLGRCQQTSASGEYTITSLRSAEYRVEFAPAFESKLNYLRQYYNGTTNYGEATPVAITTGATTPNINAAMQPGGEITGTVTAATTKAPLAEAEICASETSGEFFEQCTQTNANGEYSLIALVTGKYLVTFSTPADPYAPQFYNNKIASDEATELAITAGTTTPNINAALQLGAEVTGKVANSKTSAPIAGVEVCPILVNGNVGIGCAFTNESGEYALTKLAAGEYDIEFFPGFEQNYLTQYYNGKAKEAEATTLNLSSDSTTPNINGALQEGGVITGAITNASTHAPVSGIEVCAQSTSGEFFEHCGTSNAKGEYRVVGLITDSYDMDFFGNGQYLTQYYNGKASFGEATPVAVTEGATTAGINAALTPVSTISGTVVNAMTKAAAAGVEVCAFHVPSGEFAQCTDTEAKGQYTIPSLAADEYKVEFAVDSAAYLSLYYNNKKTFAEANVVKLASEENATGIDAELHEGGTITGDVTDSVTTKPISGINVCATSTGGELFERCAATNAAGEYKVGGLIADSYTVDFQGNAHYVTQYYNGKANFGEATPVAVTEGVTTTNINATLTPGSTITGTVLNATTKAAAVGVEVCALRSSGEEFVSCTVTGPGGEYTIASLAAASYKVEFGLGGGNYTPLYYNNKKTYAEANVVALAVGETAAGIDAELHEGGEITGTVTSAETSKPIEGITVCAERTEEGFFERCGTTNANGEYAVAALVTGNYTVWFSGNGHNYLTQYYNGKTNYGEAIPVAVTTGETTPGINATLHEGAQISGRITTKGTNAPIQNASACANPRAGGFGGCAQTNANGEYTIVALNTGEYDVQLSGDGQNYVAQYYNGKATAGEATPVMATVPKTTPNINAVLEVGGEITGTVTAAQTKEPIADISISVYEKTTGAFVNSGFTNAKGEYTAVALATGEYKVGFTSFSGEYKTQYYNGKESIGEATLVEAKSEGHVTPNIDATMVIAPPVVITPPTITGTDQEGRTLTEHHGSWKYSPTEYTYQWWRCEASGNNCNEIGGATAETYKPVFADVGHTLRVAETAHNEGGASAPAQSAQTEVIAVAPPENTKPPSITGTAQQGKELKDVAGAWTNEPTKAKWQWLRCNKAGGECKPIAAATSATYTAVEEDVENTLRVEETAENGAGPGSPATSSQTAVVVPPIPVNTAAPTIVGAAQQDKELKVTAGTWKYHPTEVKYQWLRCNTLGEACFAIFGATEAKYVPTPEDVGMTLRVAERAKNAGGESAPVESTQTAEVLPAPPVDIVPPTITGTAQQGKELVEHHGSWENNPTSYKYEWLRCNKEGNECAAIAGAKEAPYFPTEEDVRHTIRVSETAKNAGGTGGPVQSEPTPVVVPPAPVNTSPPTIGGTAVQGGKLTVTHGAWKYAPSSYADKWLRCDNKGATCEETGTTGESYDLKAADVGHTIRVEETAENAAGPGLPATSAPTAEVVATKPVDVTVPTIKGTAQQGRALTEEHGAWTNEPTSFKYQWLRCNKEGAECKDIAGATEQTYIPVVGDVGNELEVQEIAINAGGESAPALSAPTSPVLVETLAIVTPALPPGTVGSHYATLVQATGGHPTYTWSVASGSLPEGVSLNTSTGQLTGTPTSPGTANFTLQVTDSDLPPSVASSSFSIAIGPSGPPAITGVIPADGPVGGGITALATGSGFSTTLGATTFAFGSGTQATDVRCPSTSLCLLTVPPGSPGTANVTATVGAFTSETNSNTAFTYSSLSLTAVTPNTGPQTGGTAVTIGGTGFSLKPGATQVEFGALPAAAVTCFSSTSCTAIAPAETPGTVDIRVTTGGETTPSQPTDHFTFLSAPVAGVHVVFNPSPFAPPEDLEPGETVTFSAIAEHEDGTPVPDTTIYLAVNAPEGAGTFTVGSTVLTGNPAPFVTDSTGHVAITFTAPQTAGTSNPAISASVTPANAPSAWDAYFFTKPSKPAELPPCEPCGKGGSGGGSAFTAGCTSSPFMEPGSCTFTGPTPPAWVGQLLQWVGKVAVSQLDGCVNLGLDSLAQLDPSLAPELAQLGSAFQALNTTPGVTGANYAISFLQLALDPSYSNIAGVLLQAADQILPPGAVEGADCVAFCLTVGAEACTEGILVVGTGAVAYLLTKNLHVPPPTITQEPPVSCPVPEAAATGRLVFSPSPIAEPGTLNPGESTTVTLKVEGPHEEIVPNVTVFLAGKLDGAQLEVGTEAVGEGWQSFSVPSGELTMKYTAPMAPEPGGFSRIDATLCPPGNMTVVGSLFGADSPVVALLSDPFVLGHGIANNEGNVSISFSAPPSYGNGPEQIELEGLSATGERLVENVDTLGGETKTYGADTVAFSPAQSAPTVSQISPTVGRSEGGDTVTISGENLADVTTVAFGGKPSPGFTVLSSNVILAKTPPGAGGTVDVTVTTPAGESAKTEADHFEYQAPVPVNTGLPTISGTPQQGNELKEVHGTWKPEPTSFTYQWLQCDALGEGCLPIAKATNPNYVPVGTDVGHILRVEETAHDEAGASEPAISEPTLAIVAAAPVNIGPPTISGLAQKGEVLAEQHGTWTNEPTGYSYEWLRCNKEGGECKAITGAADQTYLAAPEDVGHTLKVTEVASNAGGPSAPATSAASAVVVPVPLHAVAGENLSTTAGVAVHLDGSGSTPASEIENYKWEFGDGTEADGGSVTHVYASEGTYTAKLTISRAGEHSSASVTVTVAPAPAHAPTVLVTDSSHNPIAGATVLYIGPSDTRIQDTTGAEGTASLAGLPNGTDTVYVYHSGFQPAVGQVAVSEDEGETTVALSSGEIATSTLKSHEMTLKEIEEAGIDTSDPANQNVYEFEVRLDFEREVNFHCYVNNRGEFVGTCTGGGGGGGGGGGWGGDWGGGGGPSCSPHECVGGGIVAVPSVIEGKPLIQWLILRGKVTVLKQFFEVSQVIQNLSPEPFKLAAGSATLNIPPGMSLAPTATPQSATQAVAAIPGDGSTETNWIVRGDKPNEYFLSATYHSKLEPFEAPVELEARLASPLKVWGVEALSLTVQADEGFLAEGRPYHVLIGVTDKAPIPLYNVEIEVFLGVHEHFIFQPLQEAAHKVSELKPGETVYAPQDILVPDAASEGAFKPEKSSAHFVGEEIHPGVGIEAVKPPPLYTITAPIDTPHFIHLHWQPSPGAEGYEVFSTPNLGTAFAAQPNEVVASLSSKTSVTKLPASATDAYVPGNGKEEFWAVTSIIGGKAKLNHTVIKAAEGHASNQEPIGGPVFPAELGPGGQNPSEVCLPCTSPLQSFAKPVDGADGNFWHTFTDFAIPGRGIPLELTRTYNSADASTNGPFGFGWTFPYGMHLEFPDAAHVTVIQENGSQVTFEEGAGGAYTAPPRVTATLVRSEGGWTLTRRHREFFSFDSAGRLMSERELNGYLTTLVYNGKGQLLRVTDSAGRKLTFKYTSSHITTATDPLGRIVHYKYDSAGDLTDVIDPAGGDTHFTYDTAHRMLTMRTPDQAPGVPGSTGAVVANTYDSQGRVIEQADQLGRTTKFAYTGEPFGEAGGTTTITDPQGNVTVQTYQFGELISETRGYGTSSAATWTYAYDPATLGLTAITDPNGHTTTSTFDSEGNVTSTTDALGHTTTYTYDSLNDRLSVTDSRGVTTTMTYDADGNLLTQSTPLQGTSQTQITRYEYDAPKYPGEVTAVTDPEGHVTHYAYDKYGDQVAVTNPLGQTTTSTYNLDGWRLSTVSPRGVASGEPARFTTTYGYNDLGQVVESVDPLGRKTTEEYDPDGNLTATTDAEGKTTRYGYDAADEPTTVHRADGTVTKTTYWLDGTVKEEINAAGQVTRYAYNPLGQRIAVIGPLGRTTRYTYDGVGNQLTETNPEGNVATTTYDGANEPTSVTYSDEKTPNVTNITYDADGQRTGETSGTETWTWTWDSLHRLTSVTEGSNGTVAYTYDLRNLVTRIGYPHGFAVTRGYDASGRWTNVHDSRGDTTTFTYDPDGNVTAEEPPSATGIVDKTVYNDADEVSEIDDTAHGTALIQAQYERTADGKISSDTSAPPELSSYKYDSLNQLCYAANTATEGCGTPPTGATPYKYDSVGDLVQHGETVQVYNEEGQLCWSVIPASAGGSCSAPPANATRYTFDASGERTDTAPATGAASKYEYDQEGRLVHYSRGNTTATYRYSADGLRMAKTVGKTTTNFVWDVDSTDPALLEENKTTYVYGPSGMPLEQVTGSKVLWLQHDQIGSTRVVTNASGIPVATYTYGPYGNLVKSTGSAKMPLRFAGQYEDSESGMYYLRARYYDSATGQFLTRDPAAVATMEPYAYAAGDPLTESDPTGLCSWNPFSGDSCEIAAPARGATHVWNATGGQVVHGVQSFLNSSHTIGVCANVGFGRLAPDVAISGQFCPVVRFNGFTPAGFGTTETVFGGVGGGVGLTGTIDLQVSNAAQISSLGKKFWCGAAAGSLDVAIQASGCVGHDSCNRTVVVANAGVGVGEGVWGELGPSYTWTQTWFGT